MKTCFFGIATTYCSFLMKSISDSVLQIPIEVISPEILSDIVCVKYFGCSSSKSPNRHLNIALDATVFVMTGLSHPVLRQSVFKIVIICLLEGFYWGFKVFCKQVFDIFL